MKNSIKILASAVMVLLLASCGNSQKNSGAEGYEANGLNESNETRSEERRVGKKNRTRRQADTQKKEASNSGIRQSTYRVKVLNLISRRRRKTNKRRSRRS